MRLFSVLLVFLLASISWGLWGPPSPLPPYVNSPYSDWDVCLSPDGNTLYFSSNRSHPGTLDYDIFYCTRLGTGWTNPVEIPGSINTTEAELGPNLSWDGNYLYFDRGDLTIQLSDIWVAERSGNQWINPHKIPGGVNTDEYWESSSTITADGRHFYFVREKCPGNQGITNIWRSDWTGSTWGTPIYVAEVNTAEGQCDPAISYDGLYLYYYAFVIGYNTDIFCAKWQGDHWGNIQVVSGLDTIHWEISPFVTEDGQYLYFARSPQNPNYDLYVCEWSNPVVVPLSLGQIKAAFH